MGIAALLFRGQSALRAGNAAAALDALGRAAGRAPDSPHVALHRALALADAGRLDEALAALDAAAKRWPQNPVFPLFRGGLLAEADRLDEAVPALQDARRLSSGNLLAEAYLALVAMRRGEAERPLRSLAAVGLTDNARALAALLAEVEAALFRRFGPQTDGKPPKPPEADPKAADRLRRLGAPRLAAMGRARLDRGDSPAAWLLLKLAAEGNPSLPDLFAYLGFAAYDLGRYDEALGHLGRTGAWSGPLDAIHLHRGACLYKLGRYAEALEALQAAEKADALGDYTAWIQLYLARILVALGRVVEARPHLRRLLDAEGDLALKRLRQARELLGLAVPETAPDGYEVIEEGKTVLVVKPPYADAIRQRLLVGGVSTRRGASRDGDIPPTTPSPKAGRAPMERIALPDGTTALVRHCRRGGLFGRLLGDRHFNGRRFLREIAVSDALRRRGVPTPEILAGIRREVMPLLRGGLAFVYRAEIVVREIPDALDLAAALSSCGTATPGDDFSASPGSAHAARVTRHATPGHASRVTHHASRLTPHAALAAAARLIRRAHDAGLLHPDLNARNILLCPDGSAMVLDLDRAELLDELSLSDRFAALARLYRSLHKLGLAPDPVSDADWAIFYDAYAGDDPLLLGHTDAFLARCRRHLRRHQLWWRVTSICSGGRKG